MTPEEAKGTKVGTGKNIDAKSDNKKKIKKKDNVPDLMTRVCLLLLTDDVFD